MAINGALREGRYKNGKRHCLPKLPHFESLTKPTKEGSTSLTVEVITQALLLLQAQVSSEESRFISSLLQSERYNAYFRHPERVEREEYVRFQMAEGGCGKVDYGACKEPACSQCQEKRFSSCPMKRHNQFCTKCAPGIE